jgi:hypothetical protein
MGSSLRMRPVADQAAIAAESESNRATPPQGRLVYQSLKGIGESKRAGDSGHQTDHQRNDAQRQSRKRQTVTNRRRR